MISNLFAFKKEPPTGNAGNLANPILRYPKGPKHFLMGTWPSAQDLHGARAVFRNRSLASEMLDLFVFHSFQEIRETIPFSGNHSFSSMGSCAGNTTDFYCFCTFAEGRPGAPGGHQKYRPQCVRTKLFSTHMIPFSERSEKKKSLASAGIIFASV